MGCQRTVWIGAAGACLAAGCTSYPSLLREFDSVAGYESKTMSEPDALVYKDAADRYPWLVRTMEWLGGGEVVSEVMSFDREPIAVDVPSGFARERLALLPGAAGDDLFRVAEVSCRLLLALEKDPAPLNRAMAVRGLGEILAKYRERPVEPGQLGLQPETAGDGFRDAAASKLGVLERAWPLVDRAERPAELAAEYAVALRDLSQLEARSLRQERARVRLLHAASAAEADATLRHATAEGLLAAIDASVLHGLAYALGDPQAIVREAAIDELWRLGGARIVPWILDRLARFTANRHGTAHGVDIEPQVRRSLAKVCWSLSFEDSKLRHEKGPTPLEFLHELALEDSDGGLRLVGRAALACLVRRPIDPNGAWIAEWWQSFVTSGESR